MVYRNLYLARYRAGEEELEGLGYQIYSGHAVERWDILSFLFVHRNLLDVLEHQPQETG